MARVGKIIPTTNITESKQTVKDEKKIAFKVHLDTAIGRLKQNAKEKKR